MGNGVWKMIQSIEMRPKKGEVKVYAPQQGRRSPQKALITGAYSLIQQPSVGSLP